MKERNDNSQNCVDSQPDCSWIMEAWKLGSLAQRIGIVGKMSHSKTCVNTLQPEQMADDFQLNSFNSSRNILYSSGRDVEYGVPLFSP